MSEDPYKGVVADLMDPYFTPEIKYKNGGTKYCSPAEAYAIWWMQRHPGRWALVAEGTTGLTRGLLKNSEIQVAENRSTRPPYDGVVRVFARIPHPEGESLAEALARRPIGIGHYLPAVSKDEFGWTREELADAARVARENLFPVS